MNEVLAKAQELTPETIQQIKQCHIDRDSLLNVARNALETDTDNKRLRTLFKLWEHGERRLQKLWNFDEDDNYIKFWTFPGCTCPNMDNEDNYPYGRYIQNMSCRIHGKE